MTLSNGVRTVVIPDPRASDVQITTRYSVGAIDDPPEHPGMAHLVEHLAFDVVNGDRSARAELAAITSYFNAFTTLDSTTYVARASLDRVEALLAVEASRLIGSCGSIDEKEFVREREVVINELRERERASGVSTAIANSIYPVDHAYHRTVGGTVESVSAITRDDACAFMTAHYGTVGTVVVVSGHVSQDQVSSLVQRTLVPIARREPAKQPAVTPSVTTKHRIEVTAPVDNDAVVVAWPLPEDPRQRADDSALLATAAALADDEVDGTVELVELGGERAPMLGLLAYSRKEGALPHLINGIDRALKGLPRSLEHQEVPELDRLSFNRMQHGAVFRLYSGIDDASARDMRFASLAATGRDPLGTVRDELAALNALTPEAAKTLAGERFRFENGIEVILHPSSPEKTGLPPKVDAVAGEPELREDVGDPKDAHRTATETVSSGVPLLVTRTLPNGLTLILLPIATAPVIDARLIFRSGTGDEPAGQRGVALLAAHALRWDLSYIKDLLLFERSGGSSTAEVGLDHTTFAVRGTADQLDVLLAGLRRWTREGRYEDSVGPFVKRVRLARANPDEHAASTDAWRAAWFGAAHPYSDGGLLRKASDHLDEGDAARYRDVHLTPANATLVIVGRFEPATAESWVDYLFADWRGGGKAARESPPAHVEAKALATVTNASIVELQLAFASSKATRAQRLVVAQIVAEIADEARLALGATYGLHARFEELRLATNYTLAGSIDAARAAAVMRLLAKRLQELRQDPSAAGRVFVAARAHVLHRLAVLDDGVEAIADRIEHDVDLERAPLSDLATAGPVARLTIEDVVPLLSDLDLSRALVMMRGPKDALDAAFAAIDRNPTYLPPEPEHPILVVDESPTAADAVEAYHDTIPRELADPLTVASSPYKLAVTFFGGVTFATIERARVGSVTSYPCVGPDVGLDLGYRRRGWIRAGLRIEGRYLSGSQTDNFNVLSNASAESVDVGPYVEVRLQTLFWAGAFAAFHSEDDDGGLHVGGTTGAILGLDSIPVRGGALGVLGSYGVAFGSGFPAYEAATLGIAYRH